MKLEGIHHVTAITADAQDNVDFYAGVLGLRLVKKTVNQDDPSVYHLFYSDEEGHAGSDITFFEFPGAPRGRAGDGMVHTIVWRVALRRALDFWARAPRRRRDRASSATATRCASPIRRGSRHELTVSDVGDEPLVAEHPEIPPSMRCRASTRSAPTPRLPRRASRCCGELGFEGGDGEWEARGESRGGFIRYDDAARARRACRARGRCITSPGPRRPEEHEQWRELVDRRRRPADAGHRPLLLQVDLLPRAERRPVRDRDARARASPSTSRWSRSGRSSRCRRTTSTSRPQVEANLKPITSPRQRAVS